MKQSKFPKKQIVNTIRQAESGTFIGDVCRQLGIADFLRVQKKYATLASVKSELC